MNIMVTMNNNVLTMDLNNEQEEQFLACCKLMSMEPDEVIRNLIKGYIEEATKAVKELTASTIKH
jgi:hypothetical protein